MIISQANTLLFSGLLVNKAWFRKQLLNWYNQNQALHPWRLDWKKNRDPYTVLVSEVMLQQTTIQAVLPAYAKFMQKFPALSFLANATDDEVRLACQGLGYYRRFGNLLKTAKIIQTQGDWPRTYEEWLEMPGVGAYTASAVCSIAFQQPQFVVDGNVERVIFRLLDLRGQAVDLKKEMKSYGNQLIHPKHPGDFNQAFMELGQTLCNKSHEPDCPACPLKNICLAAKNGTQGAATPSKPKVAYENLVLNISILKRKNTFGLLKRPTSAKFLKGTTGFPYSVCQGKNPKQEKCPHYIGSFRHSITHYRIEARVFWAETEPENVLWASAEKIKDQLVSNLDMKAWKIVTRSLC